MTGLVAGSGVSVSGATGNVTVTNSGVRSLTAGSNVTLGGTANAPVVNANLPISQTFLSSGALPAGSADGPGPSAVIFPTSGGTTLPVVAGGLYMFQGAYNLNTTAGGYSVSLTIENGATDIQIIQAEESSLFAPGGVLNTVNVPFSAMFIASGATVGMNLINGSSAGTNGTILNLEPLYLTRIA